MKKASQSFPVASSIAAIKQQGDVSLPNHLCGLPSHSTIIPSWRLRGLLLKCLLGLRLLLGFIPLVRLSLLTVSLPTVIPSPSFSFSVKCVSLKLVYLVRERASIVSASSRLRALGEGLPLLPWMRPFAPSLISFFFSRFACR